MTIAFGKAKIEIEAKGCVECGSWWSTGWQIARTISVVINNRERLIDIHICNECAAKKSSAQNPASSISHPAS